MTFKIDHRRIVANFLHVSMYSVFLILCKNDRRYVLPEYEKKKPDQ